MFEQGLGVSSFIMIAFDSLVKCILFELLKFKRLS